jgi:hypothetical protein
MEQLLQDVERKSSCPEMEEAPGIGTVYRRKDLDLQLTTAS